MNNKNTKSEPSEKEYGCTVCKHIVSCEPNPFGICKEFERVIYQNLSKPSEELLKRGEYLD